MRRSLRRLTRRLGCSDVVLGDATLASRVERLGVPLQGRVKDYVVRAIPSVSLDLGDLTILGAEDFLEANFLRGQSGRLAGLGFWTLAALAGGDLYVFDQDEERVRMVDASQWQALTGQLAGTVARGQVEAVILDPGEDFDEFLESLVDLYAS